MSIGETTSEPSKTGTYTTLLKRAKVTVKRSGELIFGFIPSSDSFEQRFVAAKQDTKESIHRELRSALADLPAEFAFDPIRIEISAKDGELEECVLEGSETRERLIEKMVSEILIATCHEWFRASAGNESHRELSIRRLRRAAHELGVLWTGTCVESEEASTRWMERARRESAEHVTELAGLFKKARSLARTAVRSGDVGRGADLAIAKYRDPAFEICQEFKTCQFGAPDFELLKSHRTWEKIVSGVGKQPHRTWAAKVLGVARQGFDID